MNEYEMYQSGMSITEVSKKTGIALSTLRFRYYNAGILRTRSEGIRNASLKGRLSSNKGVKRTFTDEWKENISKSKLGLGKGTSLKPNGYIEITMGENKGRSEHVVIIESVIKRRLYSNECVHHIDHNRANNSLENLQLMTRSEHSKLHAIENLNNRIRDNIGRFK